MNLRYTTRDLVILAVIAAITGVVNTGMSAVWAAANTSMGPLGGALLQGSFMWGYILAMWLVRKPGAALIIGIVEVAVEILLGNPTGLPSIGWGIAQGIGVEAVMLLSNYKHYGLLAALLAGAASSQFGTIWTALYFGWDPAYSRDVWLAVPINLISGLILSGLLGYLLFKALARTGLIRSAAQV